MRASSGPRRWRRTVPVLMVESPESGSVSVSCTLAEKSWRFFPRASRASRISLTVDFGERVDCVDGAAAMQVAKDKEKNIGHRWKSDGRRWGVESCELRVVSCEKNARGRAFICVHLIF